MSGMIWGVKRGKVGKVLVTLQKTNMAMEDHYFYIIGDTNI